MKRILLLCMIVAILLVIAAHVLYYFPRTVDDLFIYLRYAENLASGNGLVYNPPERVEGFSSLPWVFLQSLAFAVPVNAITFTKALGTLFLVSLAVVAGLLAYELSEGNACLAAGASALIAVNSYIVSWSIMGLETPMFLALMFWTIYLVIRYDRRPAWPVGVGLGIVLSVFSISRPEAPLYVLLIAISCILPPDGSAAPMKKIKSLAPVLGSAAFLFTAFIAWRYAYYGGIVPHVFYAKEGRGINFMPLAPMFARGASIPEIVFASGGIILPFVFIKNRKIAHLLAVVAACLLFNILVEEDWMPSMRFLLPAFIAFLLVWIHALSRSMKRGAEKPLMKAASAFIALLLVLYGCNVLGVESRLMTGEIQTHGGGKEWVRKKSLASLQTTIRCFQRKIPDDIRKRPMDDLGMIQQLFSVLEASDGPLERSWFIGRDIGMVGYFSPVMIFDTDGLFTPLLARDSAWRRSRAVSSSLLEKAFSIEPVAAELLGRWGSAAREEKQVLSRYVVVTYRGQNPFDLKIKHCTLPSPMTVLNRYQRASIKFPSGYFLQTLHGEVVGAAMQWRYAYVKDLLNNGKPVMASDVPVHELRGSASFPGANIVSSGCMIKPSKAKRGEQVTMTCYFEKSGPIKDDYELFAHFEGPSFFQGDHYLVGGLFPTSGWHEEIIRDVFRLVIPDDIPAGTYRLYFGFYTAAAREEAVPAGATDGNNRVLGPTLTVYGG